MAEHRITDARLAVVQQGLTDHAAAMMLAELVEMQEVVPRLRAALLNLADVAPISPEELRALAKQTCPTEERI